MQLLEPGCGSRSDRGDAHAADLAQVLKLFEEIFKERGDAVGTREHNPVVSVQPSERFHNPFLVFRRNDFDGWNFQNLGAAFEQMA